MELKSSSNSICPLGEDFNISEKYAMELKCSSNYISLDGLDPLEKILTFRNIWSSTSDDGRTTIFLHGYAMEL